MSKLRLGLIFGGRSVEHEISIRSAKCIANALDSSRYEIIPIAIHPKGSWHLGDSQTPLEKALEGPEIRLVPQPNELPLQRMSDGSSIAIDFFFPIIHGTGGEDGSLQGLLEYTGVAYAGADVTGSALQMDKDLSKQILDRAGIPVVPWITLRASEPHQIEKHVEELLGFPIFVKPNATGSSVGVSKVEYPNEFAHAVQQAFCYDTKILIEKAIDAREIEIAVLGGEPPRASVAGEIVSHRAFYDYQAKYLEEGSKLLIPAPLDKKQLRALQETACQSFQLLEGSGLARVDFLLDRDSGFFYLNELNSLPGFTETSMYPQLWEASGVSYSSLLDRIVQLGQERLQQKAKLELSYLAHPEE